MMRMLPLVSALVLAACNTSPKTLNGKVTDIWDKPVENATVQLNGVTTPATSGADGSFAFPRPTEVGPLRFTVGKEGYIKNSSEVIPPEDLTGFSPTIEVYPVPDGMGFFAIGASDYIPITAVQLKTIGTDLGAYTGLPSDPEAITASQNFIFSSTSSASELSRLNLKLHGLEFKPSATVTSVTGDQQITLNLWTAAEAIPYDIEVLPRDNYFLVTPRDELAPGQYAFSTQNMLDSKSPATLANLPVELQVAHPFQITR
ncbi:MAG: hypothetical protein ACI8S6_000733 [Myxococcota bacterium]|jgi:hypothetical protein